MSLMVLGNEETVLLETEPNEVGVDVDNIIALVGLFVKAGVVVFEPRSLDELVEMLVGGIVTVDVVPGAV